MKINYALVLRAAAFAATFAATVSCNRSNVIGGELYGSRPPKETSSPYSVRVLEYRPAPGQFIGESMMGFGDETSAEDAVAYADRRLHGDGSQRGLLSLGGYGGYVTVMFDHSVQAAGGRDGYDFSITCNQFSGSSEPGVVWVMPDLNGNELPDDGEWYELRGSDDGPVRRGYEVTYFRPADPADAVAWRDSDGRSGTIERVAEHEQCYYPAWEAEEFTLSGTLLPDLGKTLDDGRYSTGDYGWGYADNWGDDMIEPYRQKNFFRIADAVDSEGRSAGVRYVDFVRVQTAVNAQGAAGVGESSTEVARFTDENIAVR